MLQISQRLRGVKEDGEAIEEAGFMPKLKKAFGDAGVEIEDQNGELRSTYDILQDLAGVWDTLSSKQRQYLGEKAAGNRQVKVLNAIMANWDVVEDTIQKANEATGAATEGNEKYLDSIQGRITQFKSAFSDLARTTIDSDFVKGLIGGATDVTEFVTKIGGLVPILTTITGALAAIKGLKIASGIQGIGVAIKGLLANISGANGLIGALTSIPGTIGLVVAAFGALTLIASAVNSSKKSVEDYVEGSNKAKQNYEDQTSKVESLNTELENTQKLISDLESKPSLTVLEEDELSRLKDTNKELENKIKLEKQLTRIAEIDMRNAAVDAVNAYNANTETGKSTLGIKNTIQPSEYLFRALGAERVRQGASGEREIGGGGGVARPVYSQQDITELNKEALVTLREQISEEKKLLSEQGLYESSRLNQLQDDYNSTQTALKKYYDFLDAQIGNMHRVENPMTSSEKSINALIDEREELGNLFVDMANMSAAEESSRIFEKYAQDIESIKNIIKETGEITEEQLKEDFSGVFNEFIASGWEAGDVVRHLNEELKDVGKESGPKDTISIDELIEKSFLATDSYKNLTSAMAEQQKAGAISIETYKQLVDDKEGLPGIAKYLTLSADGFVLNTEAMYDYIKAQTDEQKLKAIQEYEDKSKAINQLTASIAHYSKFGQDVSSDMAMLEQLEQEKAALAAYIHELDTATGALARYKAAKQTANEDEDYTTGQSAYKDVQEGWKTGKVGTDDYREAMGFLLGDAYGTTLTGESAQKAATKVGKRYFKDEKTGVNNFVSDLKKAGLATEENGQLQLKEGMTLDSIAEGLAETTGNAKMSEDAVASLFKLLESYSETKFEWPEITTPEEQTEIENKKKQIEELGESEEQVRGKIAEVNEQITEAEGKGADTTKLESQRAGLEQSLQTITDKKAELEEGITPNVDTMSIEDAVARLEKLTTTINTLNENNIDIPVSIQGEYDAILGSIRTRLLGIGRGAEAKITAEDQTEEGINSANASIDSGVKDGKADITAENNTSDGISAANTSLENDLNDAEAIITTSTDGSEATAGAEIDKVANKKRTAFITVKTVEVDTPVETEQGETVANTVSGSGLYATKQSNGQYVWTDPMDYIMRKGSALRKGGNTPTYANLMAEAQKDIESGALVVDNIQDSIQSLIMSYVENLLANPTLNGQEGEEVEVPVVADEESSGKIVEQTQEKVDSQPPVEVKETLVPDSPTNPTPTPTTTTTEQTTVVDVEFQSNDGGAGVIGEVQETADSEPITLTFTSGDVDNLGSHVKEVTGAGIESGAIEEVYNLRTAYKQLKDAQDNLSETDVNDESAYAEASSQLMSAASNFQTAYSDLTVALGGIPDVDINADTSAALKKVSDLDAAAGKSVTKTINIQTTGTLPPGLATGTKNAKGGLALVDDGKGAELIEHVNRGTFELGTSNGPRFTQLDKGDVVHTAEETKKIISRMGKIGGFFRNGLNQAKSIIGGAFAKGVSGSVSLSSINRVLNSARKKTTSNKASSGSVASATKAAEKLSDWAKKLFDWAEIRLERLKTITNSFLLNAADAIGYAAKNRELTSAIKSVGDEIRDTTNAYDLYMKQADEIAKKTKLTQATIEKIQKGEIEIGKYNDKQQEKIKLYQEWYNKALNCVDALNDLREQEKELAKQKLDNIIQHYTNRVQQLDNIVRQRESDLELAAAQGRELQASEYNTAIDATTKKLQQLVDEKKALEAELTNLMSEGLIEKESDTWYDYNSKLDDLTNTITETKTAIIELYDTANEVQLTKLGYELDALTNSASRMSDMMSLHTAQGIEEVADSYKDLIDNGMDQIKNLERQNEEYRKQQQGLDVLSEKYQDLESKIQSNIKAIDDMKVSQEGWNDSVLDLKISQLEKYRDQLNKTNDQYERQKELQEAIEELQRVQSQRTTRVYRDGVGFTFESNQEDLKEAQQNLEDVVSNQLLSRIDDLIDALEEQKKDTNVYDAQGNLLGSQYSLPQLGTLTEILSSYYSSNNVPAFSGLKNSLYEQIVSGATNNQAVQFSFGDINLSDVNDVNTLADAIVDMLPNAVLQAINRK